MALALAEFTRRNSILPAIPPGPRASRALIPTKGSINEPVIQSDEAYTLQSWLLSFVEDVQVDTPKAALLRARASVHTAATRSAAMRVKNVVICISNLGVGL